MDRDKLKEKIQGLVPEVAMEDLKEFPAVTVPAGQLRSLVVQLRNDPELSFDFLVCLTGVDWGKELGVVYHFESTQHKHVVEVKVKTADRENPAFDTVADIWRTAEFHEREVYDLLGIRFNGHPDLRKIFLDENWVGYPLRKDYVDDVNFVEL
jgi:NADH-quinone oxidoreductase subunit C